MLNKLKHSSFYYFVACTSIIIGLVFQDFYKIPLTGGIIVLGLIWLGNFKFKHKLKTLLTKPFALCFIAFYILHLVSLLYSTYHSILSDPLKSFGIEAGYSSVWSSIFCPTIDSFLLLNGFCFALPTKMPTKRPINAAIIISIILYFYHKHNKYFLTNPKGIFSSQILFRKLHFLIL